MALPGTVPDWASDTNFSSGPESGNATKANPGAGPLAQGFVPDERFKAQRVNWVLYHIIQHVLWARSFAQGLDAAFNAVAFVWTALHSFTAGLRASAIQLYTGDLLYTDSAGVAAPRAVTRQINLDVTPGATPGAWQVAGAGNLVSVVNQADGYIFLDLPHGAILRGVTAGILDTVGQTVTLGCVKYVMTAPYTITLTAIGANHTSAGTAATQTLSIGVVSETISNLAGRYAVFLGASAAAQTVYNVAITYDDPGFVGNK